MLVSSYCVRDINMVVKGGRTSITRPLRFKRLLNILLNFASPSLLLSSSQEA